MQLMCVKLMDEQQTCTSTPHPHPPPPTPPSRRPWSDADKRGVWSASTLFIQTYFSQYLGLSRNVRRKHEKVSINGNELMRKGQMTLIQYTCKLDQDESARSLIDVMKQPAWLAVDHFAYLFNCTPMGRD